KLMIAASDTVGWAMTVSLPDPPLTVTRFVGIVQLLMSNVSSPEPPERMARWMLEKFTVLVTGMVRVSDELVNVYWLLPEATRVLVPPPPMMFRVCDQPDTSYSVLDPVPIRVAFWKLAIDVVVVPPVTIRLSEIVTLVGTLMVNELVPPPPSRATVSEAPGLMVKVSLPLPPARNPIPENEKLAGVVSKTTLPVFCDVICQMPLALRRVNAELSPLPTSTEIVFGSKSPKDVATPVARLMLTLAVLVA